MQNSSIAEMLEDNYQRLSLIAAPYDPVGGDPSDPGRFPLSLSDSFSLLLPESKKELPVVREILSARKSCRPVDGLMERLERERLLHDFEFWAATRAHIKNKEGGDDILFRLNPPQRKLLRALEAMRLADQPIRLILLKARQWGGSTCIQLYMAWLQLIHKTGLNSLIVAHCRATGEEIKDMLDRVLLRYPDSLDVDEEKPERSSASLTRRVGNSGSAMRIVSRNCKVKISTAENPDACRGGDYSLVHCSEVGLWKNTRLHKPEQIVRSACSGVLLRPLTMIVYESTANGTGTFFHREYEAAKRGMSQFKPLFVAWFEIPQYSLPFAPGKREEFARMILEGKDSPVPVDPRLPAGIYLWHLWQLGASLEAINWYVAERMKYHDPNAMMAEYPSDDVEAFVHSGAAVFDKYKVENLRPACKSPFRRGEILGASSSGKDSLRDVCFYPSGQGTLKVWKFPENDPEIRISQRYVVVVDIGGRSHSADWSVIAVFDRNPMRSGQGPEVVAQWRGHSDFDLLAWNAAGIATFYDNALLVIESNSIETRDPARYIEGDQSAFLLNQLHDAYPNLYARRSSPDSVRPGSSFKYGFHTNLSTKPMIISNLVKVIREGAYIEHEEMCLDEYLTYEQKENGAYGAIDGHHDDLLMTRAIGLHICMNELDFPTMQGDYYSLYPFPNSRRPLTESTI